MVSYDILNTSSVTNLSIEIIDALRAELIEQERINGLARKAVEQCLIDIKKEKGNNRKLLAEIAQLRAGKEAVSQITSSDMDKGLEEVRYVSQLLMKLWCFIVIPTDHPISIPGRMKLRVCFVSSPSSGSCKSDMMPYSRKNKWQIEDSKAIIESAKISRVGSCVANDACHLTRRLQPV